MSDTVLAERAGPGVLVLRLNRPEVRNAIDQVVRDEFAAALERADTDPGTRVVILTGTDPAFCAGADLTEIADAALVEARRSSPINPGSMLRGTRTPVIGAVNGACVTGGLEVALSCDFLIASERAFFADTHVQLGLVHAWGGTALLTEAVGVRRARELSLTGRRVSSDEALALGLVNRVVPHDELMPAAVELAQRIADAPGVAVDALVKIYDRASQPEMAWRIMLERDARAETFEDLHTVGHA